MSIENTVAKYTVMGLLGSSEMSGLRSFTFEGYKFNPSNLSLMAYEIRDERMSVVFEPKLKGKALYNSTENRLYLKVPMPGSLTEKALVVHEITHAVCDFQGKKMDIATSESIAYISQCMFLILNGNYDPGKPDERVGDWELDPHTGEYISGKKDKVFVHGYRIANKVINGESVSQEDMNEMRYAIKNHPTYNNAKCNPLASAGYDGY